MKKIMANLRIGFDAKERKFLFARGNKVEDSKPDFISADGWKCRIRFDGSIDCKATEIRNGKYYESHFMINKKGKVTMTRVNAGVRSQILCQHIGKWPIDGILLLTIDEMVENRKGFFKRNPKK